MGRPYKYTIEEIQELCASENITIIGRGTDPRFLIVECDICNHRSEKISHTILKAYQSKCSNCFENSLRLDAESLGMTLLGKSEKKNKSACDYRRYRLSCGHESEFQISHIRNKYEEPRCLECIVEDICLLVENEHGLEFLEKTIPHRVSVKCRRCATIFHPQVSNLKHGRSVRCPGCGDASFEKPSQLYLFKVSIGDVCFLKLGYSANPYLRSLEYRLPEGAVCDLIYSVKLGSARLAKKIEQHLFEVYSNYRLDRAKVKDYMYNGFTECLDISCQESLQNELTSIAKDPTLYHMEKSLGYDKILTCLQVHLDSDNPK